MLTRRQREDVRDVVKEEVTEALRDVLPWLAVTMQPAQVQVAPGAMGDGHGGQNNQGQQGQQQGQQGQQQGQQGQQGQQQGQQGQQGRQQAQGQQQGQQQGLPPVMPVAVPVPPGPPPAGFLPPGWPDPRAAGTLAAGVAAVPGYASIPQQRQTAQYISQMFVQAQAELAAELAANLHQLKQVISESQQIARKIESLLGQQEGGGQGQGAGQQGGGQGQGAQQQGGGGGANRNPGGS